MIAIQHVGKIEMEGGGVFGCCFFFFTLIMVCQGLPYLLRYLTYLTYLTYLRYHTYFTYFWYLRELERVNFKH